MAIRMNTFGRQEFDPGWDFIVKRGLKASGVEFLPGDSFDKTKVTIRRLRQLYAQRWLDAVDNRQVNGKAKTRGFT